MVGLVEGVMGIHCWTPKVVSLIWGGLASWIVGPELVADAPKLSLKGSVALVNLWIE